MNRTTFLVDGFNLYHSVREASLLTGGIGTRWLNIRALCESQLHVVGGGAQIEAVYYFSALATHLEAGKPGITQRHADFIECLEATGVIVELGRFKAKTLRCEFCSARLTRHEEKETDVAIAVRLFDLFHRNACDTAVIVSGDTDLAPATRIVQKAFPSANILFAFPYGRKNRELAQLAPRSFQFSKESYRRHQFPDPFITSAGKKISKPSKW